MSLELPSGLKLSFEIPSGKNLFLKKEEHDKLENAIDELKPEYRQVIISVKIEGLSLKEIGDKMNKSADAVRMLISRAMAALTVTFERTQ